MTLPRGQLADEMLQMIDKLGEMIYSSLKYHMYSGETERPLYRKHTTNSGMRKSE